MWGATVEIGENLLSAIVQIITLLFAVFAAERAQKANKQTKTNGGATMRDALDRTEAAARQAANAADYVARKVAEADQPAQPGQ